DRAPDLLRRERDVDVADAERRERVDDRVHDRRRRHAGGAFADAFDAEGVERSRRDGAIDDQRGHVVGPRGRGLRYRAREQKTVASRPGASCGGRPIPRWASSPTRSQPTIFSGTPFTWKPPLTGCKSSGLASRSRAASRRPLSRTWSEACASALPPRPALRLP